MSDLNEVKVNVEHKEVKFNFRGKKDDAGVETKRAPITLSKLPVPNLNGLISIIKAGAAEDATAESKRAVEFVMELLAEAVIAGARDLLNEDEAITSDENFPYAKLEWAELAKVTTQERRSSAIPAEAWDAFCADWTEVYTARGAKAEVIKKQVAVLKARFSPIRNAKQFLENFKKGLAIYVQSTKSLEEHQEIVSLLQTKLDALLKAGTSADETFNF